MLIWLNLRHIYNLSIYEDVLREASTSPWIWTRNVLTCAWCRCNLTLQTPTIPDKLFLDLVICKKSILARAKIELGTIWIDQCFSTSSVSRHLWSDTSTFGGTPRCSNRPKWLWNWKQTGGTISRHPSVEKHWTRRSDSNPVVPKLFWCADHLKHFSALRSSKYWFIYGLVDHFS
jgi:hypothetical protein